VILSDALTVKRLSRYVVTKKKASASSA